MRILTVRPVLGEAAVEARDEHAVAAAAADADALGVARRRAARAVRGRAGDGDPARRLELLDRDPLAALARLDRAAEAHALAAAHAGVGHRRADADGLTPTLTIGLTISGLVGMRTRYCVFSGTDSSGNANCALRRR